MKENDEKKPRRGEVSKKNLYIALAAAGVIMLFNVFAAIPLYQWLSSDILYKYSFFTDLAELFSNFLELSFIAVLHAALIYVILVRRGKIGKRVLGIFAATLFLSYILKIVMTLFDRRVLEIIDLTSSAFYFAIDTAMLLFVLGFAVRKKAKSEKTPPINSFFDLANPLLSCAAFSALILSLARIAGRVVFDISYGVPESFSEVAIMICYYLSDILFGIAAYAIEFFVISRLYRRETGNEK